MTNTILAMLFLFSQKAHAVFGEESALLLQLVTTTASQLNEMEKLVTNTEKYTQKMQEYNTLVQDEYFKAERVLYIAEDVASKKKVENLDGLNSAIRNLKYSMEEMQGLMHEYGQIKDDEKRTKVAAGEGHRLNKMKLNRAHAQVENSLSARQVKRADQLTAQNTALIHETQVEILDTQILLVEKMATTNRLLAEEMEEKRIAQMQKEKSYGLVEKELKQ